MESISVALVNIGLFGGWIFLAVHFEHWWLALGFLLTTFSSSTK